jgi:hypothetical protein
MWSRPAFEENKDQSALFHSQSEIIDSATRAVTPVSCDYVEAWRSRQVRLIIN